jgi:peptidoglycan/LPS O-acetylase OafA/YrhL
VGDSERRTNNFDVLRLVAALLVLFSHSFAVVGLEEPESFLDPAGETWGHVGVLVFFSISGYLISSSWDREPLPVPYLIKRSFRIFPALVVMLIFTVVVIGPLATRSSLAEYFGAVQTWLYVPVKALLFLPGNFDPPGIFGGNPWDGVNPSLWTLPVEFFCYIALMVMMLVVAIVARKQVARTRVVTVLCVSGVLGGAALGDESIVAGLGISGIAGSALVSQSATLIAAFFMGALLFLLREKLPLKPAAAAVLVGVAVAASLAGVGALVTPIVVPYIVLTIALAVRPVPLGSLRGWDLSYATYLYGFPIQQLIVYLTGTRDPILVFAIAAVAVAGIAAVSWRFVEKPALRAGRTLAKRATRRGLEKAPIPSS